MKEQLQFVRGAVAKKDFVPVLQSFRIRNSTVLGFNGELALCSPLACDLDVAPVASALVKALTACEGTVSLHYDAELRKLVVHSGKVGVFVPCLENADWPDIRPDGETLALGAPLLPALRSLQPFIGQDASRPWSRGVLLRGSSAFATNNVILAEAWVGAELARSVNIPENAVTELLRIGQEPERLLVTETSLCAMFPGGAWLRTQLLSADWPDVTAMLDSAQWDSLPALPAGLLEAVETLAPFVDDVGRLHFFDGFASTSAQPDKDGASAPAPCSAPGCFHFSQLLALKGMATSVHFGAYPNPCPFTGEGLRGLFMGMRV